MTDAIRKADSGYAAFAARLLAELASEEADIARRDARTTLYRSETADNTAATVRPVK